MKQLLIWGVLAVVCVGVVVWQYATAPAAKVAAEPQKPQPPLDPEWDASALIALAAAASRKQDAQDTLSELIGCRISELGWSGQAVSVDGTAVTFESAGGIGGITIRVVFREPPGISPGTSVTYRGRLASASMRTVGPNIINRVEIDDAEIVR